MTTKIFYPQWICASFPSRTFSKKGLKTIEGEGEISRTNFWMIQELPVYQISRILCRNIITTRNLLSFFWMSKTFVLKTIRLLYSSMSNEYDNSRTHYWYIIIQLVDAFRAACAYVNAACGNIPLFLASFIRRLMAAFSKLVRAWNFLLDWFQDDRSLLIISFGCFLKSKSLCVNCCRHCCMAGWIVK